MFPKLKSAANRGFFLTKSPYMVRYIAFFVKNTIYCVLTIDNAQYV